MIDDNTRLILIENPKSASSALKQILTGNSYHDSGDPRTATMNHDLPGKIKKRYPDKWRGYRSFVVVRNTWDRVLSFFAYHAVLIPEPSLQNYNFDSWVAAGLPRPTEAHIQHHYCDKYNGNHFLSQVQYTEEVDKVICLHSFDPVVRAKELEEALKALSQAWGFSIYPVQYNVNATRTSVDSMCWSEETVATINKIFEDEISLFSFQPPVVNISV